MSGKPIPAEPSAAIAKTTKAKTTKARTTEAKTTEAPMTEAPTTPAPGVPGSRTRRFKRREVGLAGGGKLVLTTTGSIDRIDDDGKTVQTRTVDDPEWPRWAIHFGLHDQDATIAPTGRRVAGQKPPRW
jgi:hypothetical protein